MGLIVAVLGIIIGFLMVTIQIIPERRRRKLETLTEKILDLNAKKIDIVMLNTEEAKKDFLEKIGVQHSILRIIQTRIKNKPLTIELFGKEISLAKILHLLFAYFIAILSLSLLYMGLIAYCYNMMMENIIFIIIFATIVGLILLIPVSYISFITDHSLLPPYGKSK